MLRLVIWLLVLANAGYFAWTQGYLAPLGLAPVEQREPERLQAQLKPEALRLLNGPRAEAPAPAPVPVPPVAAPAPAALAAETPATAPEQAAEPARSTSPEPASPAPTAATRCWVAGGFTAPQAEALRTALAGTGLARSSWQLNESKTGGRWVVYMGRYNDEQLDRKRAELRLLDVPFRTLPAPLGPGLALGTYSSEEAAQQGLQDVGKKGVRTARVVQERAEGVVWTLRLPAVTDAQRETVTGLGAAMAGKKLQPCE
jgi:cytochrome c553